MKDFKVLKMGFRCRIQNTQRLKNRIFWRQWSALREDSYCLQHLMKNLRKLGSQTWSEKHLMLDKNAFLNLPNTKFYIQKLKTQTLEINQMEIKIKLAFSFIFNFLNLSSDKNNEHFHYHLFLQYIISKLKIISILRTMKAQFQSFEEEEVGIRNFITSGKQILAVSKYLLSDFIVNEIDKDENVVKLKKVPENKSQYKPVQQKITYTLDQKKKENIRQVFGAQVLEQLIDLYEKLESGQKNLEWQYVIENVGFEKEERIKLHNCVRQNLINIDSNTLEGGKMKLRLNKKMKKIKPAARNKYIHFILFKSNIDTMGAIFRLSKLTGISQKVFSTAGLKDKRGITTQMVSVYNSDIELLKKFYLHADKNRQIWIEGFKQNMEDSVGVGDLYGNQFGLILRMLNPEDTTEIQQRVKSLRQIGMINYFGLQRFGSCGTKTHMIGVMIVQRKWKQVVETLLLEETRDEQINKLKREWYENKNYGKGEKNLPNKYKVQKNIFKGFMKHGLNYQNVFESLPRSMRTLYCHSLQSYIWNRIVSKRISKYGLEIQVGDIVGRQMKEYNRLIEEIAQDKDKKEEEEEIVEEQQESGNSYEVIVVTEDNIKQFTILDVIAPLYGVSINLPKESIVHEYLQEELAQLGLTEQDFTKNSKKLCFKGLYRKMIIKPKNVEFSIIKHKNEKDDLLSPFYLNGQGVDVEEGDKAAIRLIIQLPKSSYATMALRQILHMPSSFKIQSQLNKLYEK